MNSRTIKRAFLCGLVSLMPVVSQGSIPRTNEGHFNRNDFEYFEPTQQEQENNREGLAVSNTLLYRVYPDKKLVVFINYPVERWCLFFGDEKPGDLKEDKEVVNVDNINIAFPEDAVSDLCEKYVRVKDGKSEPGCSLDDQGVLTVHNYPAFDWETHLKPPKSKTGKFDVYFSFPTDGFKRLEEIYKHEIKGK